MPVYEYRCKTCQNQFEALRPISQADAPAPCPACEGEETMRLLSVFAASVKGGGSDFGDACATSAAMGASCCRTFAPGGG